MHTTAFLCFPFASGIGICNNVQKTLTREELHPLDPGWRSTSIKRVLVKSAGAKLPELAAAQESERRQREGGEQQERGHGEESPQAGTGCERKATGQDQV